MRSATGGSDMALFVYQWLATWSESRKRMLVITLSKPLISIKISPSQSHQVGCDMQWRKHGRAFEGAGGGVSGPPRFDSNGSCGEAPRHSARRLRCSLSSRGPTVTRSVISSRSRSEDGRGHLKHSMSPLGDHRKAGTVQVHTAPGEPATLSDRE